MRIAIRMISSSILVIAVAGAAVAGGTPAGKCAAAKSKAAGQKIAAKLKCEQKAFLAGTAVDQDCLVKADVKFSRAIEAADMRGGCVVTGDAATIESAADTCVASVDASTPTLPTCGASILQCNANACPGGSICQAVFGGPCQCVPLSTTCGGSAPACNGDCDPAGTCVNFEGDCFCVTPCPAAACGVSSVCADGISLCQNFPSASDCNCFGGGS